MFSKNNFFIDLALVVILVMAGILVLVNNPANVAGQKVPGPVIKYLGQTDTNATLKPEVLPKDIPVEFLVDPQAILMADETVGSRTTAIFHSKLAPSDLMAKFILAIEAKGWKVTSQTKDQIPAQVFASIQNKNFLSSDVEFNASVLPDKTTQLDIKYLR